MTTPEQVPPQIDPADIARTLGLLEEGQRHLEEGQRQIGQRMDRLEENQRDTNHRLDDTNRRLDDTNQRIDRLFYAALAGIVVITGALLGGLLTVAFVG